jgi:hypothetical protein
VSACDKCERPIIWAEAPGGRMLPFDEPPRGFGIKPAWATIGDWIIINGKARKATIQDVKLAREKFRCHVDTCSSA